MMIRPGVKQVIGSLLLGMLIGGTGITFYAGNDLKTMHEKLVLQQQENEALERENTLLSEQVENPDAEATLSTIHVDCNVPNDVTVQTAVKARVQKSLAFLQGKSLQILLDHPDLPNRILDPQSIMVANRKFRLRVTLVIITNDELYLRVNGQLQQ
ncbi:hypothetical protein [Alicyclobacillus fastidiosus]|uniref:Septum formation initiator n=1 Tax=Alicyclobacillus fastidiosus TaxID=392011 RepID=A0ABV5ADP8_9BACL|nr:hypothetical protein [Alicyclobacillus fastidiosus]WEH08588.1 hypothetical protein PYS47_18135 [Alicyclobacillus fastidiosus]